MPVTRNRVVDWVLVAVFGSAGIALGIAVAGVVLALFGLSDTAYVLWVVAVGAAMVTVISVLLMLVVDRQPAEPAKHRSGT